MLSGDGFDISIGDIAWDITNPFQQVVIENISYDDDLGDVIIMIRSNNDPESSVRRSDELYLTQKACLLAARAREYDKWKMFEEFVDTTKTRIERINNALDNLKE